MSGEDREEHSTDEGYRLSCWFCDEPFGSTIVVRDGILRSRDARQGGPYRLFSCSGCGHANVCERTPKGRWFASPNFRFNFLDYLFSRVLDPSAEEILAAISWFRETEEKRRYFFERDGDRRYSGSSFLLRVWPVGRFDRSAAKEKQRQEQAEQSRRRAEWERRKQAASEPPRRSVMTPYEILGLPNGASEEEVRATFQRLAVHYHPDKVHHLGEEFQAEAKKRFVELKQAYESLTRRSRRRRD